MTWITWGPWIGKLHMSKTAQPALKVLGGTLTYDRILNLAGMYYSKPMKKEKHLCLKPPTTSQFYNMAKKTHIAKGCGNARTGIEPIKLDKTTMMSLDKKKRTGIGKRFCIQLCTPEWF
jgi:hypothetical protein